MRPDHMHGRLPVVLIVPGTGQQGATRYPCTVLVEPDATNGLRIPTVFMGFQAQAVDPSIVVSPVEGILAPNDLARVEASVREAFGL